MAGRPAPVLRPYVERYGGYRQEGFAPGTHQGLPSRYMTLIVSLGPPTDIAVMPDRAQAPGAYHAFVGGLHASAATVRHDGNQAGIQLYLTPLGARTLLGLPAGGPAGAGVTWASASAPSWACRPRWRPGCCASSARAACWRGRRGRAWPTWPSPAATTTRPT